MKNVYLITGATGFIGANIVRKLIAKEEEVHILTRNKELNWRLLDIAKFIKVHETSLLDKNLLDVVKKIKPTHIFHLAAFGSLPIESDLNKLIEINLKGTINLIEAAKKTNFKILINTGSSSEYGVKFKKMKETDLPFPINDYGVIKTAATLFAYKEAIRNNLPIISFRLFSTYGPYEHKTRFIPTIIRAAISNSSIEVGNKNNVRDFVYIEDVVDAYFNVSEGRIKQGEIYNIGTGRQSSLEEVVRITMQLSSSKSKVKWGMVKSQDRQLEEGMWEADTTKTKKDLGWEAKYSLREGLRKTYNWFKDKYHLYE